jgi:hypothetical protein
MPQTVISISGQNRTVIKQTDGHKQTIVRSNAVIVSPIHVAEQLAQMQDTLNAVQAATQWAQTEW